MDGPNTPEASSRKKARGSAMKSEMLVHIVILDHSPASGDGAQHSAARHSQAQHSTGEEEIDAVSELPLVRACAFDTNVHEQD